MLILATTIKGRLCVINMQYVVNMVERPADSTAESHISIKNSDGSELCVKGELLDIVNIIYPPEKGKFAPELTYKIEQKDETGDA